MPPSFDLQDGVPLCAARAVLVAASLLAFGALTFGSLVAPRAYASMLSEAVVADRRRRSRLVRGGIVAGLLAAGIWVVRKAEHMAEASSLVVAAGDVPAVLAGTAFGHVIVAQVACLAALLACSGVEGGTWRRGAALGVATLALILEAGHSDAFSMYGSSRVLLACDVLHLLGAGVWLGGLVPLLLLVRGAPPKAGAQAARWFSPLGNACVAALAVTSACQGWILVATIAGLVGTAYGWMALTKLALFAVMLGFAAANRYQFRPALLHDHPEAAKHVLVSSILIQTGFAVAIVAAAAVLSGLPPAMHEQPTWPSANG